MSLLDTASLIVTPNGYKEGKLYSVIPSDGSGDLSVTRATTATRVNSAGLVELVPYNIFTYSSSFSNSAWAKINATVTSGQTGYDGTTNAFLIADNSTNAVHLIGQTPIVSGQHTVSIYAKANSLNWLWLRGVQSSANVRAWFNLSTGTVGLVETNGTANIESVGNGWYRCELTIANHQSGFEFYVGVSNANGVTSYVGSGQSLYIQDAQLVEGSVAKDYQKTETRLNIPRLDYSNGTCPSILVEPQRTNLLTWSSSFDTSPWIGIGTTVTPNTQVAPDGTTTGDTYSTSQSQLLLQTVSASTNTTYTLSMWVKLGTATNLCLVANNTAAWNTIGGQSFDSSDGLNTSTWTRIEWTFNTPSILPAGAINIHLGGNAQTGLTQSTGTVFIWGAQLEAGSYATSYIPTTSASVTRNADVISKTGISSLIGQTEGTLFLDVDFTHTNKGSNEYLAQIWVNSLSRILLYRSNVNGGIGAVIIQSSSTIYSFVSTVNTNERHKIAFAYKSGDIAFYIDGSSVSTSSSSFSAFSSMTNYDLGINTASGSPVEIGDYPYKAASLWKTRLTNTQLAQLTTI